MGLFTGRQLALKSTLTAGREGEDWVEGPATEKVAREGMGGLPTRLPHWGPAPPRAHGRPGPEGRVSAWEEGREGGGGGNAEVA